MSSNTSSYERGENFFDALPTDHDYYSFCIAVDGIVAKLEEKELLDFTDKDGSKATIAVGRYEIDLVQPLREVDDLPEDQAEDRRDELFITRPILEVGKTPIIQISEFDRSIVDGQLPFRPIQRLHMQFHVYDDPAMRLPLKGKPYLNLQHRHYGPPSQAYRCDKFNQGVPSFTHIGETSIAQAHTVIGIGNVIRSLIDESLFTLEEAAQN